MKKIGTITFHRSLNYGSVLQTFALQAVIKRIFKNQCSTEIIDFYPPGIHEIRSVFVPVHSVKNLVRNVLMIAYAPVFAKRRKEFDRFLTNNVVVSKKKYTPHSDMSALDQEYDILIAGSDQIWNNKARDFSDKYFFSESKIARKVAYAPSIGNGEYTLPAHQIIYDSLKRFDAISVRELSGARKLSSFLDTSEEIPVVLDPTLLLDSDEYKHLEHEISINQKYIFLYSVKMNRRTLEIAKTVSEKTGLPIISIYTTNASIRARQYGIRLNKQNAPEDFLGLIHHAELIISDSFHGTAFSVNYGKKFYSICAKDPSKRDDRLETILSRLGFKNRMLFFEDFDRDDYLEELDYSEAMIQLNHLRSESFDFLANALLKGEG